MATRNHVLVGVLSGIFVIGGCTDAPPVAPFWLDGGIDAGMDAGPDAAPVQLDAGNPPPTDAGGGCQPAGDPPEWPTDADACWRRTAWSAKCPVEQADRPELAVPPLAWGPCPEGSAPGCEAMVTNWPAQSKPVAPLQVLATGSGYRVAAQELWASGARRTAFFDEMGHPFAAYRAIDPCYMLNPLLTPTRLWFGVLTFGPSTYTVGSYDQIASPTVTPVDFMSQGQSADDDLLALWLIDGLSTLIYDRVSNESFWIQGGGPGSGSGYAQPFVVNGNAIVRYYPAFEKPQAWIWTRKKKVMEPLIQPQPEVISDFRSDGQTLVWVQNPPKPVQGQGSYPPGNLWTSPFATSPADLQPKMRRPVPVVGESIAGGGYYAFYSSDKHIHVYRLSDAHHWDFALSPGMSNFFDMSFIDEKYIWFNTRLGEYRQPLNTLGPGDPPP